MGSLEQSIKDDDKAKRVASTFAYIIQQSIKKDFRLSSARLVTTAVFSALEELRLIYGGTISNDRIVHFLIYQIYRYRDMIPQPGTNWKVFWCFSNNAVHKYKAQFVDAGGKAGMSYYMNQWCDENGIDISFLCTMIADKPEHPMAKYLYMPSEENTKRRWYNTTGGYILCQSSTTGWAPQSEACRGCSFAKDCEKVTEKKYPELVRLRKEKN